MVTTPSFRVYIAAPYPLRDFAVVFMHNLEAAGIAVTSRWLKVDSPEETAAYAQEDLDDVEAADVLLVINPVGWENLGTGGRHVELGYALRMKKPIVVFGVRSNVFHQLPLVTVIDEHTDLIGHLEAATGRPF